MNKEFGCVPEDFRVKKMTKAIIEAVSGCACEDLDLELLQRKIQNLFQRKKYFLVLDDVWDDEQDNWQKVENCIDLWSKRCFHSSHNLFLKGCINHGNNVSS